MPMDFDVSRELIADAYDHGMTVSDFMEVLDPSSDYAPHERVFDAYQRQLIRLDIRPETDLVERFYDDEGGQGEQRRAMFPEYLSRVYRDCTRVVARNGGFGLLGKDGKALRRQFKRLPAELGAPRFDDGGVRFPTGDVIPSFSLYPAATPFELRFQQLIPSALNVLIARTRPVAAGDFRALYLVDAAAQTAARMGRVAEYADLPVVRFDTGENAIALRKYGRRIQISYEAIRRMAIDMLNWSVMYVAAKADADKEATIIDVLINGDGNSGTAATSTNGSTLDAAAAGALTLKMWTAFRFLWDRPYASNVVYGTKTALTLLLLLQAGSSNIGPRALTEQNVPDLTNIRLFRNTFDAVVAVDNANVTANNLGAVDANWSAEMVSEVGADIVQSDLIIQGQYNEIAISETIAFDIATKGQNRLLAYTV